MKQMDSLRAAFGGGEGERDYYDRRIRTLAPGFNEQFWKVSAAVADDFALSSRMYECGDRDESDNMKLCRIPLCPRCFMTRRGKETAKAIKKFKGATNERMAFMTLLMPVTTSIDQVGPLLDAEKRRIINLIVRKRRHDARWNNVHMTGFWELDRIRASDIEKLGRNKRIALEDLGSPMLHYTGITVWLPHLHAIVDCGEVDAAEIATALRADGRQGAYQVNMKPFLRHKTLANNLKSLVRYSMKFRIEDNYKSGAGMEILDDGLSDEGAERSERNWWPQKDIKQYAVWSKMTRGGFRSLRFEIGKAKPKPVASDTMGDSPIENGDRSERTDGPDIIDDQRANGIQLSESRHGMFSESNGVGYGVDVLGCRYIEPLHDTNWLDHERPRPTRSTWPDDDDREWLRTCQSEWAAGASEGAVAEAVYGGQWRPRSAVLNACCVGAWTA